MELDTKATGKTTCKMATELKCGQMPASTKATTKKA